MKYQIVELLEQFTNANSIEKLHELVLSTRETFEVEHTIYHSIQQSQSAFALASYSAEWANYYESEKMFLADPVVLASFQKFEPYEWKTLDWSSRPARRLMLDATDGGVGNQGVSIPMRGPHGELALYSVNTTASDEEWQNFIAREMHHLLLVGHYIHAAARRLTERSVDEKYSVLSPREIDSLTLLGLGENRARVAEKLKISEHTLRVYIESSRSKLQAANTTHAVAKAMMQGLITL
ncbi:hypothetical protein GCM10007939_07830 [Amylibacter marinus]|uniref:HTH luxR-type domain-containing protein n=1 Tax=Amylibacter marinus TaxID=1475483 RepID=A0ABQ5VT33_9RHOB|nr:autoinducer binding domain-containing protein [Amylibacter marinus]GLQ34500.1 hypothetical protein GCM10007939_07830 [Amylibacter marinus]